MKPQDEDRGRPGAGSLRPGRGRFALVFAVFVLLFAVVAVRLLQLGFEHHEDSLLRASAQTKQALPRPELQDRNGNILAIDVPTSSLYADPAQLIGVDETAEKVAAALPDLDADSLRQSLSQKRRFVWLKRFLTPEQRKRVFDLGLPGLYFMSEPKRFYPVGALAAQVTGFVDADNHGLAAMERAIDEPAIVAAIGDRKPLAPVRLSLDLRVQEAVTAELRQALERYQAKAGVGIILDIRSGEVLALASLPSFDPMDREAALQPAHIDRARRGVYELGSVLKCFTLAMGIDEGVVAEGDRIDVATPLSIGHFSIKEEHKTSDGTMSLDDVFVKSSNVGAARIARKVGIDRHRAFLSRLGLLDRLNTEAGAAELPLQPAAWHLADSLSIAYGYRLSVAPLQLVASAAALFNGGTLITPTFLRRPADEPPLAGLPVVKTATSRIMRRLMRLNVLQGTGRLADVPGYRVGGKTGTARKFGKGGYGKDVMTSFLAIFPAESPRYISYVMLDAPQKVEASRNINSASMNAAPTTAHMIARIAPLLGVKPEPHQDN